MKYLYCIVIFCFLGCTCKKGEIPEGSICPEYGSSIGRHFTWDEADSVKQKAAYFLLSQINSYTCNSAGQTAGETIPPAFLIRHIESKVGQYRTCSWLKGMTFETFSEYLLPYRVGDEDPFRFPGPDTLYRTKFDYLVRHYDDCRNSPYQLGHFLLKAFSAGEAKFPGELVPEVYKLRFFGYDRFSTCYRAGEFKISLDLYPGRSFTATSSGVYADGPDWKSVPENFFPTAHSPVTRWRVHSLFF